MKPATTPTLLANKGKDWEELILKSFARSDHLILRNGVKTFMGADKHLHKSKSFPDFSGVLKGGRHLNIEAKSLSSNSLSYLHRSINDSSQNQLFHLMSTSEYGGVSYYFIHFNERVLKTKTVPALSAALPVHPSISMWQDIMNQEKTTITRMDCIRFGFKLSYHIPDRCRNSVIDLTPIEHYDMFVKENSWNEFPKWRDSLFFC